MNYPHLARRGVRNAFAAALYIALIAWLLVVIGPHMDGSPKVAGTVSALLLFVVSALVTASLVLWSPVRLLVDGKKAEAGALLCITGATLVLILAVLIIFLVLR